MSALPLEPNAELLGELARVITDPGSVLSRDRDIRADEIEPLQHWQARAILASLPGLGATIRMADSPSPAEEALARVEALADELEREATVIAVRAGVPPLDFVRLWRDDAPARIRAAAAPVAQSGEGR